jgi:ribonuclease D
MAALHTLGKLLTEDLPEAGTQALVEGKDSPSLRQLAGSTSTNAFELEELLQRSLEELGLPPATKQEALRAMARYRAEQIVRGEIEPARGAGLIWRLFTPEYPEDVTQFLQLEEMHDDPYHRRNKKKLAAEIIKEAKRYLESH